jgi:hypothetical protein
LRLQPGKDPRRSAGLADVVIESELGEQHAFGELENGLDIGTSCDTS